MVSIKRAKELADEWAWQAEEARREAAICHHFDGVRPKQLIEMWETGNNLKGKPLSDFEVQALGEAWCRVFGDLPPGAEDSDEDPSASEPDAQPPIELPADDTMLRTRDVLRLTGLSLSTLKRMVVDGRFPKPVRLSPRRIGWPARDVRAWLDSLDGARQKKRV
jgi:prophage regulatory protein